VFAAIVIWLSAWREGHGSMADLRTAFTAPPEEEPDVAMY